MINLQHSIKEAISSAFLDLFDYQLQIDQIQIQPTRKDFEGTYTFVMFPFLRITKKSPEQSGELIGDYLKEKTTFIAGYNVVKGFLNLTVENTAWVNLLDSIAFAEDYGKSPRNGKQVMVEYSSPNTNKPLHLGHLRNNFLGNSISRIYDYMGYDVIKAQIINDRGIHICKSMLAWQKFGNGETPEQAGIKGDKLVGNYYVEFERHYRKEVNQLVENGIPKEEAERTAPMMVEAQEMLRKWEAKDSEVYTLWQTMNGWVYDGFNATYEAMGVDFDKLYYESDTYLSGRDEVLKGLDEGVFVKREDGSVWVDLSEDGLDEKILLRSDGTSVYMTQDIGTAIMRFNDFPKMEKLIYVVGNEQEYHFNVLFLILSKLGFKWSNGLYHLSYGMVDLPSGKMKSREGTVVDADDLIQEMLDTARRHTEELGKIDDFTKDQAAELYEKLALGALKYYLLKVDPRKRMLFNPEESIEFHGNTGPFIQYTHARISAILRKANQEGYNIEKGVLKDFTNLNPVEADLVYLLSNFPHKVNESGEEYSPSIMANYVYDLAKEYNRFYQEVPIFNETDKKAVIFRITLSYSVAQTIRSGMGLLGIDVPERM